MCKVALRRSGSARVRQSKGKQGEAKNEGFGYDFVFGGGGFILNK